jgi:hypothetical protein
MSGPISSSDKAITDLPDILIRSAGRDEVGHLLFKRTGSEGTQEL